MAFREDIATCIKGNSTVNLLVTGGIYYDSTPIDSDKTKSYVVYDYDRVGSENTTTKKDVIVYYDLEVQVISKTALQINDISNALYDYLMAFDTGKIRDISLTSENKIEQDDETKLFYKTDIYTVMYERI